MYQKGRLAQGNLAEYETNMGIYNGFNSKQKYYKMLSTLLSCLEFEMPYCSFDFTVILCLRSQQLWHSDFMWLYGIYSYIFLVMT